MGISRRRFLGFVGVALAGSSINPLQAVIVRDDYYANQDLGLGFVKPASWSFESFKDFGYLIDKVVLSRFDEYTAASLKDEMYIDPLVLISKYPLDSTMFNPSICIYLENYDGMEEYEDFGDMIPDTISGYGSIFKEFELLERYPETSVSECRAFRIDSKCLMEHTEIEPTTVKLRTMIIFAERGIYTIHLQDSKAAQEIHEEEYERFIQSLQIV